MALGNCRECGKEVSTEAKTCPSCGVDKPIKKSSGGKWLIIFFVFAFVIILANKPERRNSDLDPNEPVDPALVAAEKARKEKEERQFQKVAGMAMTIKKAMRDPDSLTWESIRANDDASIVCFEYRAKNGFGGMNKEMAIVANGKADQKASSWNKHCTQPLTDMMKVKYAL